MADIAVELAIKSLDLLINEVSLVSSLSGDVKAINSELRKMVAFLKIAEERAQEDDLVKDWVKEVRILAYDIEDVIEEYQLYQKGSPWNTFKQICSLHPRRMANDIKSLRQRASDVRIRRNTSTFNEYVELGQCSSQDAQLTISSMCIAEEFELVGTERPKQEIIKLMDIENLDLSTSTIAVVGKRGLGKTTVVRSVYNDTSVSHNFLFRAWVCVPQYRTTLDMLRSIAKQLYEAGREAEECYRQAGMINPFDNGIDAVAPGKVDQLVEDSLIDCVSNFLKEKRYMVVFDDVQEYQDINLKVRALPQNEKKGSKILITTRDKNVARDWVKRTCDATYKFKPLPLGMAWKLFCKKTFQSDGGICPAWLEDRAREVLNKCEGMPLIILAVGRLLSAKPSDPDEWKKVRHSLGYCLKNNPQLTGIHKILIRSYYDLPHNLKPCFLYFGLFPKGYHVDKMRLIRLWIAEGFITEERGLTLEEVAEESLNELLSLSLVEIECKDSTERPKTLRVHEFLHEIILSKLQELSFCQVLSTKSSTAHIENPRRLSIHNDYSPKENISKNKSKIRCLLIEHAENVFLNVLNKGFSNICLLKVLDLRNAPINDIPKVVGELLNLRYLSLRNTRVERLPSSIGKLQDLQTLDLKGTYIHELPTEINELHKLRHLLTYRYDYDFANNRHIMLVRGVKIPEQALGKLEDLQKLAFVDVSHKTRLMQELKNLTQLRKLGIVGLKLEDGRDLCAAIKRMKNLQAFSVFSKNLREEIDLDQVESPPTLKRLYLNGPLKFFPRWISGLYGLVKIRLRVSRLLNPEFLETLRRLPNLVELQLFEAYHGLILEIGNEGFQKLKILELLDLLDLEYLLINEGALPLLEQLSIGESPKLQVPSGIIYLSRLKTLNFFSMSHLFDSFQEQYYSVVEHVPNVYFQEKGEGSWRTYTLR